MSAAKVYLFLSVFCSMRVILARDHMHHLAIVTPTYYFYETTKNLKYQESLSRNWGAVE